MVVCEALAKREDKLEDVTICGDIAHYNFAWHESGYIKGKENEIWKLIRRKGETKP